MRAGAEQESVPAIRAQTTEPVPPELHNLEKSGWHLEVWKSTYEANDPSEDRSTVVIDPESFVFAGVWDGHGRLLRRHLTACLLSPRRIDCRRCIA